MKYSSMLSQSTEDYLKTIYSLSKKGHTTVSEIAHSKEVAPSSVTSMVKKLIEMNFVKHDSHRSISLTETGKVMALKILRKHRLLELFLVEVMGYTWDEVHEEACALEHHISEKFEETMDQMLGKPSYDPHGDPIPDIKGELPVSNTVALSDMDTNKEFRIARILQGDPEFLQYLQEIGVTIDKKFSVKEKHPFGGPVVLQKDGKDIIIGKEAANNIYVELV